METNRRNTPRCASICLAVVFFCTWCLDSISLAQTAPEPRITGTYLDMHYIEEAGDVLGTEIRIAYAGGGFQGVVQMAEGARGRLMLVDVVQSGNDIRFELPADNELPGSFRGKDFKRLAAWRVSFQERFHRESGASKGKELLGLNRGIHG